MIKKLMTEHPNSVGENYFQHMLVALSFSGTFLLATIVSFVHAFMPFLFVKTGSLIILKLYDRMVSNRHNQTSSPVETNESYVGEYII